MKFLDSDAFDELLRDADFRPRYKRDLKFVRSTEHMDAAAWENSELLPIWNKSEQGGVLLLQPHDTLHIIPFDASKSSVSVTGRTKSIICDLCYTWRSAGSGRLVTFYPYKSNNSLSILCCADLRCSENVRNLTDAARRSRTQLREDITTEGRIERLRTKIDAFLDKIA